MKTTLLAICLIAAARLPAQDSVQAATSQKTNEPSPSSASAAAATSATPQGANVDFSSKLFAANGANGSPAGTASLSNDTASSGPLADTAAFPRPYAAPSGPAGTAGLALQSDFAYDPALHAGFAAKSGEIDGVPVKMQPFHVSERRDREAAEAIDEKQWVENAKDFKLVSGGRLWEGSNDDNPVEFGLTGQKDILPDPSTRPASPEWDLLTLRF
jgi:hypothetical protein